MKNALILLFIAGLGATSAQADRGPERVKREIRANYPRYSQYIDQRSSSRILVSESCGLFYNERGVQSVCDGFTFCIARPSGHYLRGETSDRLEDMLASFGISCMDGSQTTYPSEEARRYILRNQPSLEQYLDSNRSHFRVMSTRRCGVFANDEGSLGICDGFNYCLANANGSYLGASRSYSSNSIQSTVARFKEQCL